MALAKQSERVETLARQVAEKTGEDLTEAVVHSLEERLQRLENMQDGQKNHPDLVRKIMDISARCSALPDLDDRSSNEILAYDPHGAFG